MPICDHEIKIAVIIVIEEFQTPAAHELGGAGNTRWRSEIVEGLVVLVSVHRIKLMIEIGNEQVHPAVLIEIRGVHTHPGAGFPSFAEADAGGEPDLFEAMALLVLK